MHGLAVYLIGTFGSALAAVYSYNASNTSGHTKKVHVLDCSSIIYLLNFSTLIEHNQRDNARILQCRQHHRYRDLPT